MKVLWFSVSPSLYSSNGTNQGLGWIASLERIIRKCDDIELGIAFEHKDDIFSVKKEGVTYYPMNVFKYKKDIKRREFHADIEEKLLIPRCLKVIDDFEPDVIHVFGSEWCFGLVQEHISIPVVIHMQGCMPPYENAMFPPGYSWQEEHDAIPFWNILWKRKHSLWKKRSEERAAREERILHGCKYFMGRTEWDYAITRLYAPHSVYYKCWEALRPQFTHCTNLWQPHVDRKKFVLLSSGPSPLKGMDVVLKTAKLLLKWTDIDFEWRIYGATRDQLCRHQRKWNIDSDTCQITCLGTLDEMQVAKELLDCDLYVHLAYIDNSPNAVCEAMCLGVPIITTNVGGIPSLIENDKTGVLVPANEPWMTAYSIVRLFNNTSKMMVFGKQAHDVAVVRHNEKNIQSSLRDVYSSIISNH